ncbi:MAG: transketolase family protein [Roseburia sp.]|nr:hypothetical protein [Anaeroplasma bactoclasticum]MCM1196140.1 transketolase family protein [Roseburia sp.]MCM1557137.1 hypothetical protein [Anaeroplasma bactoclasticum]
MSSKTNRQAICDTLLRHAEKDKNLVVLCSDSRGSASLTLFANAFPQQFVEIGIAEQNLVSVAAGLASCGKKTFVASPACFLSTRSYEQIKVDVAYSNQNVKLIGISGGVSYGALGLTHHSTQDIAALAALPNMRVYLPSDYIQTIKLIEELLKDELPAYIRVSRMGTKVVYEENMQFKLNHACEIFQGKDGLIVTCGELVSYAKEAAKELEKEGLSIGLIDMYCLKPFDEMTLLKAAKNTPVIFTFEEHSKYGGLGSMVASVLANDVPKKVIQTALPDGHIIAGSNQDIFKEYGLDTQGMIRLIRKVLRG